jgi:DNA-binding PadR family transcriptional regulator
MYDNELRLPSGKELVILDLLAGKREMYGLEMVKASKRLARGTVYVLLNRMEDKGYVTSRQVKDEAASGMPKRVYSITGLGQRALAATRAYAATTGLAEAW